MRVSGDTSPASSGAEAPTAGADDLSSRHSNPLELIEVRAPYCALQNVAVAQPGQVSATVAPEQAVCDEAGDIAAAEAGRHMAILGSVACATQAHTRDPARRFYYLAERAVLTSFAPGLAPLPAPVVFRLNAQCLQVTARQAEAKCQISRADGSPLFGLHVTYKLVPEKIFQRLFAAFRVDMRRAARTPSAPTERAIQQRQNPYRNRLGLSIVTLDERHVRAELPSVPAEACAGHFPLYPAVPVAVLMEVFSNAGGALLRKYRRSPELRYRVRDATIQASKLVFAGQAITVHGEVLDDVSELGSKIQMRACSSDGEEVSSATFVMECVAASQVFDPASAPSPSGPETA